MDRESVKARMCVGWQEKEQEETWKAVWEVSDRKERQKEGCACRKTDKKIHHPGFP